MKARHTNVAETVLLGASYGAPRHHYVLCIDPYVG